MAKPKRELGGPRKMSTATKIIVALFAVIMVVSMMLPSLTQIFAGSMRQTQQSSSSDSQSTSTENKDGNASNTDETKTAAEELAARVPDNETIKSSTETYAKKAAGYEKKLAADPKNLAALLNAGQTYMNWGYGISYSAQTDDEKAFSNEVIKKATEYFDRYLAIEDSKSVKVDKALCQSLSGDTAGATAALEKLTQDDPTYPLAWANLGMLYQNQGDTEKATEAYKKAVETDPNDEYGVKSYANQQIISINSKVSSPGDAGDASVESSSSSNTGFSQTLSSNAGVGF